MKWGQRNGPPYPLDAGDHSASEKKAGWRKSLDNDSSKSNRHVKVTRQKSNSVTVGRRTVTFTEEIPSRADTLRKIARGAEITIRIVGAAYAGYRMYDAIKSGNSEKLISTGAKVIDVMNLSTTALPPHISAPLAAPKSVPKMQIPDLKVNPRVFESGTDYTAQILKNFGDLSSAAAASSAQVNSAKVQSVFNSIDDLNARWLNTG